MLQMKRWILFILLVQVWACASPSLGPGGSETLVFLVRHAERADDGVDMAQAVDPPLSDMGKERAALLAEMLKDVGLTHIHSTDSLRTRGTAAPTAEETRLEVSLFNTGDMDGFAQFLRSTPGRHLVVGHSNTTWDLVKALEGDPGLRIESTEYDRLYLLAMGGGGVSTVLIRYGELFRR